MTKEKAVSLQCGPRRNKPALGHHIKPAAIADSADDVCHSGFPVGTAIHQLLVVIELTATDKLNFG
jgi:hypothetical protein